MRDLFGDVLRDREPVRPERRVVRRQRNRGRLQLCADVAVDLAGTSLFYPSAWEDLHQPVLSFAPFVSSFWFADINYNEDVTFLDRSLPRRFCMVSAPRIDSLDLPPLSRRRQRSFAKTYRLHAGADGSDLVVRMCGADGPALFRMIKEPIGVFFYRGDGDGEGGSSIPWLSEHAGGLNGTAGQLPNVLDRLVDGGLIVTDGCNQFGGEDVEQPYGALGRFCYTRTDPLRAFRDAVDFTDAVGRRFRCVGFVEPDGFGKGPTLVWQVG